MIDENAKDKFRIFFVVSKSFLFVKEDFILVFISPEKVDNLVVDLSLESMYGNMFFFEEEKY